VQPRNEPKQRQQAGQKSTINLMLYVFVAMIISSLSIDTKADENDWFAYLGTQEAQKSPRKNINPPRRFRRCRFRRLRYAEPNARNPRSPITWLER